LFATRDVNIGELLFAEKAFAFQEYDSSSLTIGVNFEKNEYD